MKKIRLFLISFCIFFFSSCPQPNPTATITSSPPLKPSIKEWSFLIYMAADNDLEPAAISDINELEAIPSLLQNTDKISILVILDRSTGYDASNSNWSDTRFFEIIRDPAGFNTTIVSKQLNCFELGLSLDTQTELDMANPMVLSQSIDYMKRAYPADNYGLLLWGHGTGWRGEGNNNKTLLNPPLKAVAFDDATGSYMTMPSLDNAVTGKNLSLIGFDTCFGALLEVCYQIRDDAEWFIGSEGVTPSSGWDYTLLFTAFLNRTSLTASDFCDDVIEQFKTQYNGTTGATISKIHLTNIENLFSVMESFAGELADSMTTSAGKELILNNILYTMDIFHYFSFPSDMYVDIYSFTENSINNRSSITSDTSKQNAILSKGTILQNTLNTTVTSSWSKEYGTSRKQIGIHIIPLQAISVPDTSHALAYYKTSSGIDKNAFVEDSIHWTPNLIPQPDSFLDKLFYWTY
jgi:hypothetical protein